MYIYTHQVRVKSSTHWLFFLKSSLSVNVVALNANKSESANSHRTFFKQFHLVPPKAKEKKRKRKIHYLFFLFLNYQLQNY